MGTVIGVLENVIAVPSTNRRFIKLAPTKLPKASPPYPFLADEMTVDNSGKLVPRATTVAEMIASEIPALLAETCTVATKKLELSATIKPEIITLIKSINSLSKESFSFRDLFCSIVSVELLLLKD